MPPRTGTPRRVSRSRRTSAMPHPPSAGSPASRPKPRNWPSTTPCSPSRAPVRMSWVRARSTSPRPVPFRCSRKRIAPVKSGRPAPASVRIASRLPPTRTPVAVPSTVTVALASAASRWRTTGSVVISARRRASADRGPDQVSLQLANGPCRQARRQRAHRARWMWVTSLKPTTGFGSCRRVSVSRLSTMR